MNNGVNNNMNSTTNTNNTTNNPSVPIITGVVGDDGDKKVEVVTKKSKVAPILFIIIILLAAYIVYSSLNNKAIIQNLTYNCTPISSADKEKKLDLESTIVRELYEKVRTDAREDVAQPEWNDTMKLYLAYRQITDDKKYDSNCNLFNQQVMAPYTCNVTDTFTPKAFKEEELELEWKKLYGERTPFTHANIKLDYDCIGGYQYIADRKEYVEGYCSSSKATLVKADKNLIEATTNGNTVVIKEEVKYTSSDSGEVPEYLKNGIYTYTFRLDMNYNYVLVSRTYEQKY